MNTLSKSLMAMGLAAVLTVPASAQERRGPGGPGGGMMGGGPSASMLLSNRGVQDELKLDDAQKEKVVAAARKAREAMESAREAAGDLEGPARFAKMRELGEKADAEAMKSLADVLKPEQTARLKGIHLQTLGASAFAREDVRKALKLTDDQNEAVKKALADSRDKMREAFQGDREAAGEKLRELRKETVAQIEAKLTDEQKAEYSKLVGAPYEVRFEGRGPGGPGGPGGRRGPGGRGGR